MAKTKISEFSATPGNNTDIDGINIAEGCAPSGINDAIRELMAQLKDFQAGTAGDSFNGPVGTTTAAAGAFTTLTTSGAVTHNGGTANGVAYLNGSKVLTTGSALTFDGTNFATTGSGTLKNLLLSSGTLPGAGNPSISLRSADNVVYHQSGSANTIVMLDSSQNTMQSIGATAQIWNISNSEQMRLTSTGLGIGTSSPSYKLDVSATGTTVSSAFRSDQSQMWMMLKDSGTTLGAVRLGSESGSLIAYANGNQLTYNSSGNLGLGVTPSAWYVYKAMQVGQSGAVWSNPAANELYLSSNYYYSSAGDKYIANGYASFYRQLNGAHTWATAPSGTAGNAISFTQAMTLDASGNLGIGTSSPSGNGRLELSQSAGNNTNLTFYQAGNGKWLIGNVTGDDAFRFYDLKNSAERARITSGGDLLVGTTGTAYGIGTFLAASGGNVLGVSSAGAVDGTRFIRFNVNTSTEVGNVTTNGTSTAYNTTSDYRLKDNIAPMTGALARVAALKPCIYKWKADGSDGEGFIAHELAEVVPQCVTGEKDAVDAEGKPVYQGIDTSFLVATLTAALQEAHGLIKDLQARVDALEAK